MGIRFIFSKTIAHNMLVPFRHCLRCFFKTLILFFEFFPFP